MAKLQLRYRRRRSNLNAGSFGSLKQGEVTGMAAVFGNLYDALREAGVPDDKARRAAEELFEQTAEVGIMRAAIGQLQADMTSVKRDIMELKAGGAVVRWMIGFNIAMTVAIVGKLFLAH